MNDIEQRELLRRQLELLLAAPRSPSGGIEPEVADLEHVGRSAGRAGTSARSRASSSENENGLSEVVVGARVEALDPILHRVTRGEHQHRRPDTVLAQRPARREAVDARAASRRARSRRTAPPEPSRAPLRRGRDVGRVALLPETSRRRDRHLRLVFDQEHPHRSIVAARRCERGEDALTLLSFPAGG